MTATTSTVRTPLGDEIIPCWVKDIHDLMILLNAMMKGCARACDRRFSDVERKGSVASGLWCWIRPTATESKVMRWTDGVCWSSSRIYSYFLVYREVDEARRHVPGPRRGRPAPYDRETGRRVGHTSAPMPTPATEREHRAIHTSYDRSIVAAWTNNADFTVDGICKKTMQVTVGGIEYRLVSYYNTLDAQTGHLPRASEVPQYRDLEMDQKLLDTAKWISVCKKKGGRTKDVLLKDLLLDDARRDKRELSGSIAQLVGDGECNDDADAATIDDPISPPFWRTQSSSPSPNYSGSDPPSPATLTSSRSDCPPQSVYSCSAVDALSAPVTPPTVVLPHLNSCYTVAAKAVPSHSSHIAVSSAATQYTEGYPYDLPRSSIPNHVAVEQPVLYARPIVVPSQVAYDYEYEYDFANSSYYTQQTYDSSTVQTAAYPISYPLREVNGHYPTLTLTTSLPYVSPSSSVASSSPATYYPRLSEDLRRATIQQLNVATSPYHTSPPLAHYHAHAQYQLVEFDPHQA